MWIYLVRNYQDNHKYYATLDISLAKNTLAQLSWKNLCCAAFDISLAKQNILAQLSCKNLSCTAFDISQAKQQNLAQPSCKKTFSLEHSSCGQVCYKQAWICNCPIYFVTCFAHCSKLISHIHIHLEHRIINDTDYIHPLNTCTHKQTQIQRLIYTPSPWKAKKPNNYN